MKTNYFCPLAKMPWRKRKLCSFKNNGKQDAFFATVSGGYRLAILWGKVFILLFTVYNKYFFRQLKRKTFTVIIVLSISVLHFRLGIFFTILKVWWQQPLFLFISIFFRTIHSFIHPFAEGPLLFPHCSSLSRGPPWGAEPGFELGPAVQQADALLSELRRTLNIYIVIYLKAKNKFPTFFHVVSEH